MTQGASGIRVPEANAAGSSGLTVAGGPIEIHTEVWVKPL